MENPVLKSIIFAVLVMAGIIMPTTFVKAEVDCSMLDPRSSVSTEKEGKINASVNTLYKIAKAGGSVEGRMKEEIHNLQKGAPVTEKTLIELRTLYLFCGMVANAKDITTDRKVELFNLMMKAQKETPKRFKQKNKKKVSVSNNDVQEGTQPQKNSQPTSPRFSDKVDKNVLSSDAQTTTDAYPTITDKERNLPGISFRTVIKLNDVSISSKHRKYIFDFGQVDRSRLSLYLSPDGIFTFSFIDAKGETHPIYAPIGNGGVPFGKYFYLVCEVGVDGQSTLMRMIIDENELKPIQPIPYKIDLGEIITHGVAVGSDLHCENSASFDLVGLNISLITMTKPQIVEWRKIMDYNQAHKSDFNFITLNGQCMSVSHPNIDKNNKLFLVIDPNYGYKKDNMGRIIKLYDLTENYNDLTIENK